MCVRVMRGGHARVHRHAWRARYRLATGGSEKLNVAALIGAFATARERLAR